MIKNKIYKWIFQPFIRQSFHMLEIFINIYIKRGNLMAWWNEGFNENSYFLPRPSPDVPQLVSVEEAAARLEEAKRSVRMATSLEDSAIGDEAEERECLGSPVMGRRNILLKNLLQLRPQWHNFLSTFLINFYVNIQTKVLIFIRSLAIIIFLA